jgi:hypothetical protein
MSADTRFYRDWILANGFAESIGLGTTFAVGIRVAPLLEQSTGVLAVAAGVLAAVILGTLLEGVLVGVLQGGVLRRRFVAIGRRDWVVATALGAGLAWLLGMMPSTVIGLLSEEEQTAAAREPGLVVTLALAAGLGLAAGPILGFAQWTVLRRLTGASRWLWANALAWAVGMPLIFVGMDLVPWSRSWMTVTPLLYAWFGVVGGVVGAIHGRFLLKLQGSRATGDRGDF